MDASAVPAKLRGAARARLTVRRTSPIYRRAAELCPKLHFSEGTIRWGVATPAADGALALGVGDSISGQMDQKCVWTCVQRAADCRLFACGLPRGAALLSSPARRASVSHRSTSNERGLPRARGETNVWSSSAPGDLDCTSHESRTPYSARRRARGSCGAPPALARKNRAVTRCGSRIFT
jgi:hypothetical protein